MKAIDVLVVSFYFLAIVYCLFDLLTGRITKNNPVVQRRTIISLYIIAVIYCIKMILEKWK